jgi:hypothetical protein
MLLYYFTGSRDHFTLVLDSTCTKHAWQQLRQDSSTQKFYIIKLLGIFFNRNWPSILYQDPKYIQIAPRTNLGYYEAAGCDIGMSWY